jgi:hypothetical protein
MEKETPEKKGFDWGKAVELLKDGVDLAEKVVGGRNAFIAGAAGLALGFTVGAITVSPSDSKCATFYKKELNKNSGDDELWQKWLKRRSSGW